MSTRPSLFRLIALCILFVASALVHAEAPSDRPLERFNEPIKRLEAIFSLKNPSQILEAIPKEDARGTSFALEGLLRLYQEKYPQLTDLLAKSKRLEDQLGAYNDSLENVAFGKSVKVPQQIMTELVKEHREQRKILIAFLKSEGWVRTAKRRKIEPAGQQFRDALGHVDWMPPAEDARYLLGKMVHQIKHIEKSHYQMADVTRGLHPFRRAIRWLLIYMQATRGLVALKDGGTNKKHGDLLNSEIANGPYSRLPTSEPAMASFPRRLFLFLNQAVAILGHMKDMGVAREEWLKKAILKSGYVKVLRTQGYEGTLRGKRRYSKTSTFADEDFADAYARELTKRHPEFKPVTSTAKQVYHATLEKKVLPPIRHRLEKARERLKACPLRDLAA